MATSETIELMSMITHRLNEFFVSISYLNHQFEDTAQARKNQQDRNQKLFLKAFSQYKSKKACQLSNDLSEKQKQKLLSKNWDKLSDGQKLKYSQSSKLVQKKAKKRKDDDNFRPGLDD